MNQDNGEIQLLLRQKLCKQVTLNSVGSNRKMPVMKRMIGPNVATYKRKTKETLREMETYETAFEGKVITDIVRVLPEDATLFASNSMPIRDTDSFFFTSDKTSM